MYAHLVMNRIDLDRSVCRVTSLCTHHNLSYSRLSKHVQGCSSNFIIQREQIVDAQSHYNILKRMREDIRHKIKSELWWAGNCMMYSLTQRSKSLIFAAVKRFLLSFFLFARFLLFPKIKLKTEGSQFNTVCYIQSRKVLIMLREADFQENAAVSMALNKTTILKEMVVK